MFPNSCFKLIYQPYVFVFLKEQDLLSIINLWTSFLLYLLMATEKLCRVNPHNKNLIYQLLYKKKCTIHIWKKILSGKDEYINTDNKVSCLYFSIN